MGTATTNKGIALFIMFLVALGLGIMDVHKRLAKVDENLQATWSKTDVALQQRLDLIPAFVTVLKTYAPEDTPFFVDVALLRQKWDAATLPADRVKTASALEKALNQLLYLSEKYPDFKTSERGIYLLGKINQSKTQYLLEYRHYGEALQAYNKALHSIPGCWMAWAFGLSPKSDYFKNYQIIAGAETGTPPPSDQHFDENPGGSTASRTEKIPIVNWGKRSTAP